MPEFEIRLTKTAKKDYVELQGAGLGKKVDELLKILVANPFQSPPPYKELSGEFRGTYSRRINRVDRLVYEVHPDYMLPTVVVVRMRIHYEGIIPVIMF